ncbi:LLM class flavin-dependent oxidoreductase [Streptomyces sp. NPDC099088]|uniref:LLM class flavin-dependent oxidoreductase n=1 Tax=Streptomyces sp. NPDC099088 TaxID=3366101 RepID=UPI00381C0504
MKFGWFVYFQERGIPTSAMFEEYLKEIQLADRLGYDEVWLAEHHFSHYATLPSPNIVLAAIAARTSRIRIGNMVTVLPLYDPLRLAEEVGLIDQLSNGRFNLGIGSGVAPDEFSRFGMSMSEAKPRFNEALQVLLTAFTQERFDFEGDFYKYRDVSVVPKPVQAPYPPLCQAVFSAQSTQWCANRNIPIARIYEKFSDAQYLSGLYRDHAPGYSALVSSSETDHSSVDAYPGRPSVRFFRPVYVAETTEQAMAEAIPELYRHFVRFAGVTHEPGLERSPDRWRYLVGKALKQLGPLDLEQLDAEDIVIIGDPQRVKAKLERLRDEAGMDHFVGIFAFGNLSHERVNRSLELFAKEVMRPLAAEESRPRELRPDGVNYAP